MRIAVFSDAYLPNINGVSYAVEQWLKGLTVKHQAELFVPAYERNSRRERRANLVIHRYSSLPLPTYKDIHLALPKVGEILRQMEEFQPEVVHFHSPGPLGLVGILAAKKMRLPLVGTYHTLYAETLDYVSMRKILEKYLKVIDRLAAGLNVDWSVFGDNRNGNGDTIPQRLTWSVVNRVYSYADVVTCPSMKIKKELIRRGLKRRMVVITNGIDLEQPGVKNVYNGGAKIFYAGRLGYEKNVDVAVKAFRLAAEKEHRATLTIAGDGPASKSLVNLVEELELKDKVRFLGMVERNKLMNMYREFDVFVTASDMETQGLVVLEAMASGLPVVGVNKYALPDLIKNGRTGYLVPPGDTKRMAEMLVRIISDKKLAGKLGKAARKEAGKHDIRKTIVNLERVYKQLAKLKKPGLWDTIKRNYFPVITSI